jgi:hypothetical protein
VTPRPRRRLVTAAAVAVLSLAGLTGCELVPTDQQTGDRNAERVGEDAADTGDSRAMLDRLAVSKAGLMKGYSRTRFPHWRSTGDNCDVRDTVLKRDGTRIRTSGCNVVAGRWTSVYEGATFTDPTKVDVDHMVPLANAWRSGAATWTDDKRGDFANDLTRPQLIAVSATTNRAKGDQDPSTWKPQRTEIWCQYAQDWIAVKDHWKLSVTANEKNALTEMLGKCT